MALLGEFPVPSCQFKGRDHHRAAQLIGTSVSWPFEPVTENWKLKKKPATSGRGLRDLDRFPPVQTLTCAAHQVGGNRRAKNDSTVSPAPLGAVNLFDFRVLGTFG